ncbi:diguanylate cyclase [Actinoplanes sp. NPDC051411]|uniref:diguanylate cyclase n=1 Tax=Actinoplanes sp. NPDC051411 TaxID=3155522 RepID=UPI00341AC2C7
MNGRRWFVAVTGLATLAHPFLASDARAVTYFVSAALNLPPILLVLRRAPRGARAPWALLLAAMAVLSLGNAVNAFGGTRLTGMAEMCVTIGHGCLLAAAIALVLLRGRNDIGGILDLSVAAVAVGGLAWTTLLYPRLRELGAATGDQTAILVSILVLAGVLGALLRLWLTDRRQPTVGWFLTALVLALVANTLLARLQGNIVTGRGGAIEVIFMVAYGCVGLAMLSPSVDELMRPGRAPADQLTTGRLLFLGLALLADPVAAGVRQMLGLPADGPLLTIGSLLVTPLVMIRVGRLAKQRQEAEHRLRHQATHDQLTGLPNRAELLARLAAELRAERGGEPAVVLLFCDLNGFKQVNDRLGHEAGDQLLAGVSARLGAGLRAGDTVARYGGDEFLVLSSAPGEQDETARRLTAHVEDALAAPFRLAGEQVTVGASIGAVVSDGTLGPDELISRADQAMYAAKQRHRAGVRAG